MSRARRKRYRSTTEIWALRVGLGVLLGMGISVAVLFAQGLERSELEATVVAVEPAQSDLANESEVVVVPTPEVPLPEEPVELVMEIKEPLEPPKPIEPEPTKPIVVEEPPMKVAQAVAAPLKKEEPAKPTPKPKAKPSADRTVSFRRDVVPILQANCYGCHGAEKDKGDLRLHQPDLIRAGGKFGGVVVAGDPERSSIYYLTTLPADDPDIMPAKGDNLTKKETEVLRIWIEEGADMEDGKSLSPTEKTPLPSLAAVDTGELSTPTSEVLDSLGSSGFLVKSLTPDGRLLYLSGTHRQEPLGSAEIEAINVLAPNLHSLDLSRTKFDADAGIAWSSMKRLRELRLQQSSADDATLAQLAEGALDLEYLNLYDTPVTDAGLGHLGKLKQLQEVYLWRSDVSATGVAALQRSLPEAKIDKGE